VYPTESKTSPDTDRRRDSLARLAVDAARLGVWEYDIPGRRIRWWNARMYELHGVDPDVPLESLEETLWSRVHPDDLPLAQARFRSATDAYRNTYRVVLPGGRLRWLEVAGEIFHDAEGSAQAAAGVVIDVTESREAEARLSAQLAEIEAIYSSVRAGLCVIDGEYRFLRVNERLAEINGVPAKDHVGRTVREVVPDLVDFAEAMIRRVCETGEASLDLELSGITPAQPGVVRHWVEQWVPLRRPDGSVFGVNIAVEEVTAWKQAQAQLQRLAEELGRSNRDLEQFAYAASHDLQEPLRTIFLCLEVLRTRHRAALDPGGRECLDMALDAARHGQDLVQGLLQFARVSGAAPELERVPLGLCLDRALLGLREALADAQVHRRELPEVLGHAVQLTQLLQNVLANASKFRRPEVPLRVHVGAALRDGRWVVSVADNGQGVPEQHREHVFRLFARLHDAAVPGTGIGLSICKRIVERHGGRIWLEASPEGGTTVLFTLPPAP
jgi:PAS domain S-box-containing protein